MDASGRARVPLSLLLLGVLMALGRGTCFDGIEELSNASAEVHRRFFHSFNAKFVQTYYSQYVFYPETPEDIQRAMNPYSRMGLPGCIGSVYCVHVRWDMCSAGITNLCCGKKVILL